MSRRFILGIVIFLLPLLAACNVAQAFAPAEASASTSDYITYTVQSGDTVAQIATRFHVTIEQIINLNSDKYPSIARDPSSIKPGWQFRIPRASAAASPDTSQVDATLAARQIIDGINTARAQKGWVLLKSDASLTRIASDRSKDMITRNYFSHYDPQTGQEPFLRYLQATGFSYHFAGENIAELKNDAGWVPPWLTVAARYAPTDLANEFVKGWLNSPEHRANIMNGNYRRTGVAISVETDGRRIVATQVFSD